MVPGGRFEGIYGGKQSRGSLDTGHSTKQKRKSGFTDFLSTARLIKEIKVKEDCSVVSLILKRINKTI